MKLNRIVAFAVASLLALGSFAPVASAAEKSARKPAKTSKPAVGAINLNSASAEQLASLPGVGEKLAARIVEYRTKQGPFKSTQELMNVKGVGEKNFQRIQAHLTVAQSR
jgi:competence protein ComEA